MGNINYSHPYSKIFSLNYIPTINILKNGQLVYAVTDTIAKYLKTPLLGPTKLEDAFLAGFKK
ncbi:hypothetical protein SDC9_191433 [bioreactor metagenome]|uniref:Uncharacterized protein n=1 Tax=bioreactor metagenome TaxID=1076179 RepID=A0A645HZF9_9ZZZZ